MGNIIRQQRNAVIGAMLQRQWEQNYLANRKEIQKHQPMMPVYNRNTDIPALVVGAGPSLKRNIGDIESGFYTVIAVDKAVPKLIDAGVSIDYIVALNSVPTDVEKWIAPANKHNADEFTTLVMPCTVDPETYAYWDGPKMFINAEVGTGIHMRVEAECQYLPLVIGSNAGAFAYFMAMYLGHNPIAMCGMDFSFLTRKEVMDKYIMDYRPDISPIKDPVYGPYSLVEMTDINGAVRFLDIGWLDMAETFQEIIKTHRQMYDIETYNCTEGGINYSDYVHATTLKEFNKEVERP